MTKITAYRTPPQQEFKAAREARDAGHRAYVPTEPKSYKTATGKTVRRRVPVVPGVVFATGKPTTSGTRYEPVRDANDKIVTLRPAGAEAIGAKHIRAPLGTCDRLEVRRLYTRGTSQPVNAYTVGETIEITRGHATTIPATVMAICGGGWYEVGIMMMGKLCKVKMRLPSR